MWKPPEKGLKRVPKSPAPSAARTQDAPDGHHPLDRQIRRRGCHRDHRNPGPFGPRDAPLRGFRFSGHCCAKPCQPEDNGTEFARHSFLEDALGLAAIGPDLEPMTTCCPHSAMPTCLWRQTWPCQITCRSMNGPIRPLSVDLAITNGLPGIECLPRRADLDDLSDEEIRSLGLRSPAGATVLLHRRHEAQPCAIKVSWIHITS